MIDADWNAERHGLAFCRISGKGSLRRYRQFFEAFEIKVSIIADLDCIIDGFEHLDPPAESVTARDQLIQAIDEYLSRNEVAGRLSARELRDIQNSQTRRTQFEHIVATYGRCLNGEATLKDLQNAGREFFEDEQNRKRRTVLQHAPSPNILTAKRHLLSVLRTHGLCLLEKGDIESYYPDGVTGPDKPSKALDFCRRTDTREKALSLCDKILVAEGTTKAEFELIFERIFGRE